MSSTDPIVAAARRLTRALLKDTPHCPEIEFVDIRTSKTGCDTIATHEGFDIRLDKQHGAAGDLTPEILVARVYHAAAHMLCIQAGVSSHSGSRKHTQSFDQALAELGAPDVVDLEQLTKTQRTAAESFAREVARMKRTRSSDTRTAYVRSTVACPADGCRHTLTLRTSAIAKTRFLCVEHREEMTVQE